MAVILYAWAQLLIYLFQSLIKALACSLGCLSRANLFNQISCLWSFVFLDIQRSSTGWGPFSCKRIVSGLLIYLRMAMYQLAWQTFWKLPVVEVYYNCIASCLKGYPRLIKWWHIVRICHDSKIVGVVTSWTLNAPSPFTVQPPFKWIIPAAHP